MNALLFVSKCAWLNNVHLCCNTDVTLLSLGFFLHWEKFYMPSFHIGSYSLTNSPYIFVLVQQLFSKSSWRKILSLHFTLGFQFWWRGQEKLQTHKKKHYNHKRLHNIIFNNYILYNYIKELQDILYEHSESCIPIFGLK